MTRAGSPFDASDLDRAIWWSIGLCGAVTMAGVWGAGLSVDLATLPLVALVIAGLLVVDHVYGRYRDAPSLALGAKAGAQFVAFSAVAGTLSYVVATLDRPVLDADLASWDKAIGFDWLAYFHTVVAHPILHVPMKLAYIVTLPATLLAVAVLIAVRRPFDVRIYLLSLIATAMITIAISGLMPALNTYVHFGLSPADHPDAVLPATLRHIPHLLALRDGSLTLLRLAEIEGIITFPSFHSSLGVLIVLALWPVRVWRWIALGFSTIMIAGTPVEGSHYLVDVIAGGAIAAAVTLAVRRLAHPIRRLALQPAE